MLYSSLNKNNGIKFCQMDKIKYFRTMKTE